MLAYRHLKNYLEPFGYAPTPGTVSLQKHNTLPTVFFLCVDYFFIKIWSKSDAEHLFNAIGANFKYTVDIKGKNYCGLALDQNYKLGFANISMLKFLSPTLKRLKYMLKVSPQHSPYRNNPITCGKKGYNRLLPMKYVNYFYFQK